MVLCHERGNDGPAKTAGLTLVELLVVIAMTGLLAAIMLPALSTAKERTRRAVCKNNERQLLDVFELYAERNDQLLPSSADNKGYYHSIIMSDSTFTELVSLIGGESNIFYCPNIVFGASPNTVPQHNSAFGYVIGYSYLAGSLNPSTKGPDYSDQQVKVPSTGTNELLADANYWTTSTSDAGYLPSQMKVAPHTAMGAFMSQNTSFTVGLPGGSSASVGAVGGNIGFSDFSVQWRTLPQMQTNSASSPSTSSMGLW
jgi:type II secretory pathway pseudopilin PulG